MNFELVDLQKWGTQFQKETDLELLLLLNTNLGSVAYRRDFGIDYVDNNPMYSELTSVFALQIIDSIERYNQNSRRERQIITDFDSIQEIDFDDKDQRKLEDQVGYFRLVDYIKEL